MTAKTIAWRTINLILSITPTAPGFNWPTWKSKIQTEKVFMMVNAIETRRNKGAKKQ